MIDPPNTFWGVCNTTLPIPDKYLINTYLLNPILGKDWIIRVGVYCILPTNDHDYGPMMDPPDTFRGVCNTPLPIRGKNLIPIYRMNLKPDTCLGVCNMPLPIRYKYLINTYLLNLIPSKNWIVHVVACCIRHTNTHDHWQMIDPLNTSVSVFNTPLPIWIKNLIPLWTMNLKLGTCWGVCNTPLPIRDKYLINNYLLNLIPVKDWMVCVGAYYIRPTNSHDYGQMIDSPGTCGSVCNTPLPIRDKYLINMHLLNLILGKDWIVRVGAYCIRPTNANDHG